MYLYKATMNRNRKGNRDMLLVIANLGLALVLSRMNFGCLHTETVNVLADFSQQHSSGESACPLCKVENVGQKTNRSEIQELLTETIHTYRP